MMLAPVLVCAGCACFSHAPAQQLHALNPLVDYRATGQVHRYPDGTTVRSAQVIAAFRQNYPCPATKNVAGACPGWAIDHVIPLACGGADAVYNLQWLPNEIKSARGAASKDRFERVVYGGQQLSRGCM